MMRYSPERKESVLKKMLPPHNRPISELAREEGISEPTLYNWRKEARSQGRLLPDAESEPEGWTSRDKFAAVLETASLNEAELAEYCRKRGLYPEQVRAWVLAFVRWYNHEHRHSGIRHVTPQQRHSGADTEVLQNREAVYEAPRHKHPERWRGKTRNWEPVGEVWLNRPPECEHPSVALSVAA